MFIINKATFFEYSETKMQILSGVVYWTVCLLPSLKCVSLLIHPCLLCICLSLSNFFMFMFACISLSEDQSIDLFLSVHWLVSVYASVCPYFDQCVSWINLLKICFNEQGKGIKINHYLRICFTKMLCWFSMQNFVKRVFWATAEYNVLFHLACTATS